MPTSKITYTAKDSSIIERTDPAKLIRDVDINEIKTVVNAHADAIDLRSKNITNGNETIAANAMPPTKTVTHGAGITPEAHEIIIILTSSLGNANQWWIQDITGTSFTMSLETTPLNHDVTFSWRILT